jgi:hypothetical protein
VDGITERSEGRVFSRLTALGIVWQDSTAATLLKKKEMKNVSSVKASTSSSSFRFFEKY